VDSDGRIVAGHGRAEAARQLGLEDVPVIPIEHLTEAELRAYALADNKLAENAGWDTGLLKIELQELQSLDLGFDIEITGFGTTEIDVLIDG
jgi:ParB-like chromosome segregation protein Spo0J